MIVTMLSLKVISRCGSAASRRRIVEYWLWSAMQNNTGSEDFTNGSQNCLSAGGLDANHAAVEAPASNSRSTAIAGFPPLSTGCLRRDAGGRTSVGCIKGISSARVASSAGLADSPEGRPGQEY